CTWRSPATSPRPIRATRRASSPAPIATVNRTVTASGLSANMLPLRRRTFPATRGRGTARAAVNRLPTDAGYPLRAKATAVRELGDGWDELEIPYGHGLDAWLVEFGPDVVVLEPAELRADVVDRLRAVAKG
ncbi:WYL domain-containing protein, partial [Clavibacter michiganensis]|uniref:WYL domain-containing protein n=1 Tax=Clavibacter michiganensis TaxID=28447 RepID=UPI00292D42D3